MIETGKKVTEEERLNFMYVVTGLNTCIDFLRKPLPKDMSVSKVEEYYGALSEKMAYYKVEEHLQRCLLSDKYDVPYDFILRGDSLITRN